MIRNFLLPKSSEKHPYISQRINNESPIIIEVGAHFGTDTSIMLNQYKNPSIYCFEPDPRNIEIFHRNVNSNAVKFFPYAVSNAEKENVPFFQATSKVTEKMLEKYNWIDKKEFVEKKLARSSASSLKKGHEAVKNANQILVDTITLDTWNSQYNLPVVDLLWIDVQGAEKEVLEGAKELLLKTRYVWVEYGEIEYEGGMDLAETKKQLGKNFSLATIGSYLRKKGDALFKNKKI
tara:strand:- start:27401 stop:28105 length:705 start_codon:yes stop_codon:yes gene_type:complete